MQADLSPRAGIGPALRRAREARGVSLDAVSRSTRIRPRYLAALEDDAGSDAFPGPIYARFFLKEYARYLGVDDAPLVSALDERGTPPPAPLVLVGELVPPRRWVSRLIRVAAVGFLLGLAGYTLVSGVDRRSPAEDLRARLTEVPTFLHRTHASVGTPHPDVPIRTVVLVTRPTFVRAFVDGRRVVKRTVQPRRLVLRSLDAGPGAPSIDLEVADGSAVKVVVNGRRLRTEGRAPFHARFVSSYGRTVRL
jgi:transcriptional regulator with XRE-family HTH domain